MLAPRLFAQSDDDLFARAFGQKKKAPAQEIALRLLLGDRPLGTVATRLGGGDQEARLQVAELAELLRGLARPELIAAIAAAPSENGMLPLSALRALGVELEIDAARLELYLELGAADRERVEMSLRQRGPPEMAGLRLAPAARSAFANFRFAADLAREPGGSLDFGAPQVDVDGSAFFGGTVFEGRLVVRPEAATPLQRGDLRLVRDRPERQQRWLLGDLSYPVLGFQAFRPALGVAVAKDFSLDPYRVVQPLGEVEILVESPSRAELVVNGLTERSLRLAAGRYRISDFFLESGLNEVELRITDAAGRLRVVDLSLPFERDLLRPGLTSYAAALGVEAAAAPGGWRYDSGAPLASALFRRGLSETLTVGGGLQADHDQQVASATGLLATRFALFDLELALSEARGAGGGVTARLGIERYLAGPRNPRRRHWTATFSWRGAGFLSFAEDPAAAGAARGALQLRMSQRLAGRTSMGISASFEKVGDGEVKGGATLSLRRALAPDLHLGVDTSWRKDEGERGGFALGFSLTRTLPRRGHQLRASWDSAERVGAVEWSHSPAFPVGSWSAGATVSRGEDGARGTFESQYLGDRGEAGFLVEAGEDGSAAASVRGAFSLVALGGRRAIGRPIEGAFALLAPHPTLAGLAIGADRSGERFALRVRPFGGVVPDLAPYLARALAVEITDLPAGYDPGPGLFQLLPRYKSGTVVPVGTGGVLAVAGRLLDGEGQPVALASGRGLQEGGGEPKVFFTNRAGRFRIEGLAAGGLALELDDGRRFRLQLPDGARGVVEVGELRPEAAP